MIKFPTKEAPRININLAALIDIVFLLLIYFLLTSNFIEQDSIDLKLPKVESVGKLDEGQIVISIDRYGNFYYDKTQISDQNLDEFLALWISRSADKSVLIKADRNVAFDRVVRVMDLSKKHGARKLLVGTEPKWPLSP
ncbi:MAG: biopolymer transporter ExbD [Sideroxydans sp.]|nr:biopolymer transporter ExbD [Sideroxydans sp.]